MKTKHKMSSRSKKKSRANKQLIVSLIVFGCCFLAYCGTRLFLQSCSNTLAVQNQTLTLDIEERTAKIESLKSEITKLQEKSRVLGMLEGQVYDNKNNVYYYGD